MKWYEDPVYILMCERAKEIQKDWKPKRGDFTNGNLIVKDSPNGYECIFELEEYAYPFHKDNSIYLPRQDQLQDMVNDILLRKIQRFYMFARSLEFDGNVTKYSFSFNSIEQLWLAFVMKERFGKVWNNNSWISFNKAGLIPKKERK